MDFYSSVCRRWNGRCTHAAAEPWGGVLDPIDGFDSVAGRDAWFAGSAIVNGQRLGPPLGIRSVAANSNGSILFANVHVGACRAALKIKNQQKEVIKSVGRLIEDLKTRTPPGSK
jgi:hypothetical protein